LKYYYGLSAALIGISIALVQSQEIAALPGADVGKVARKITVLIDSKNYIGSGVIIQRQENTYYVLTAKHVVAIKDKYAIVTADGKRHQVNYSSVRKLPGVDLAVLQFTSNEEYTVAEYGDSDAATVGTTTYVAGFPQVGANLERDFRFTPGQVSSRPSQPYEGGYAVEYTNLTYPGTSGGPVLDENGHLIGIHGRGLTDDDANKLGLNLGIPLNGYRADIDPFGLAHTLSGHSFSVYSVAFSPDGKTLASGSGDKTIKIWNVTTGQEIRTLKGHSDGVISVAFSPDGKTLASGSADKTIKIWNVATGQEIRTLSGYSSLVRSVAFSPDGKTLASGSRDDTIKIWNVATGQEIRTLSGHSDAVISVAFSPDGKTLASGSEDKTIKIWNVATGQEIRTLEGHSDWVFSVAFSLDGKTLASGSEDKTIKIWNVATGQEIRTLKGHSYPLRSVAFSPAGKTLASGSMDKTIKIWNVATGQEIRTLKGHSYGVNSVAFSPDGKTLASGSHVKTIIIWPLVR